MKLSLHRLFLINAQPALMYYDAWHTQQLSPEGRLRRTQSNHESLYGKKGLPAEIWFKIIESMDTLSRARFAQTCKEAHALELGAHVRTVDLSYTSPQIPAEIVDREALNALLGAVPTRMQDRGYLTLNLNRCYLPPCFSEALQDLQTHHPVAALHLKGSTLGLPDRRINEFSALIQSLPALTHLRMLDLTFGMFESPHVFDIVQSAPVSLLQLILDKNRLERGHGHPGIMQVLPRLQNLRTLSLKKSKWPQGHLQGLLTALQTLPRFQILEFQENGLTQTDLATLNVGHIQVRI